MKWLMGLWILGCAAVSTSLLPSDPSEEKELYNDYCFEQQSSTDALFEPLETFPRISEKATEMLGGGKDELVMYSEAVFTTILSRINTSKGNLAERLLYYDNMHSYGVNSIRKLYFDQLRNIQLVKQTALSRSYEVMMVHSSDVDFFKHFIHHQKTLTGLDSLAMASIRKINNVYMHLLSKLDTLCQKEEVFLLKRHNLDPEDTLDFSKQDA